LARAKRAAEERADVEWVRNQRRRAEEEAKARLEPLRTIRRIISAGDIIEVLGSFRRGSTPGFRRR
jgi:hypothetical protein